MSTSVRQSARAGAKSVLDTYKAANPTRLAHVYDHRPSSANTPCAWVEKAISEEITFSASVRFRVLTLTVKVLNKQVSNKQAADEQDVLVDGLIDAFTTASRTAVAGGRIIPASVSDSEEEIGQGTYAGFDLELQVEFQEGRTV